MRIVCSLIFVISTAMALRAHSNDAEQMTVSKTLFVYDSLDKDTKIYIEAFRDQMNAKKVQFDEMVLSKSKTVDVSPYETIVIYSRVMAFNLRSPVRKWLRSVKKLQNKKVYIFVTANKFFEKKNLKDIVKLVAKSDGEIIDAVSMATGKLSEEQKAQSIAEHLVKLNN
jgi:menaquinone-dependent protoporphyrinogen IX oxidase